MQEDGSVLLYATTGSFAQHLLELHVQGRRNEFPAVAEAIERLHMEGDSSVREAATIGILEGIQNIWGNDGVDPELFGQLLLPESRRWWDELNAFWRGERRYVGEGFQKTITDEDIKQIREEIKAFNERLRREREGKSD